jgi:hypothetical protein
MSVPATNSERPRFLNSLTELSRMLDEATVPPETPPVPMTVTECSSRTSPSGRGRPGFCDGWLLGLSFLGGLWLLYGMFVMAAGPSQPGEFHSALEPPVQVTIGIAEELADPVQEGRGGRTPQLVSPLADTPDCLGTRVSFVDSLAAASRQAKDRDRLLMVLNVSGDFDDSRFT